MERVREVRGSGEGRAVVEREGGEGGGKGFEGCGGDGEIGGAVCEGEGGDEAEWGAGVAGYDGGGGFFGGGGVVVVAGVLEGGDVEGFEGFELLWVEWGGGGCARGSGGGAWDGGDGWRWGWGEGKERRR